MKHTSNLKLALYESDDVFNITGDTDSLNSNMNVIDESISNLNNNLTSHNHDSRYYTEAEMDAMLDKKAGKDIATQSENGLMSAADKTKLDGIEEGANKTIVDAALNSTSTNTVQNKVIDAALAGKANTSHTHTKSEITDFPTSLPASDVSEWAKASTKPTYTASEVGADASGSANTALTAAKAYTDTEIAGLINGAPTTLDTLGEIATAMSENQNVVEALNSAIGTKANVSDLTTHTGNTSNPHSVTKAQVGLGNVPNVSTNDQTPTYSDTTTFETLTSGEKISVALGKIKLAITNLINHIANKSNPHGVTKSQIGLGNVGNFKAVSTVAGQGLTEDEKANARTNIGVGTSSFSGDYNDLSNKPVVDTALSSTSTNTVQNKVVNAALNEKADKSKYGDTTINVGRKADTTVGTCSTAEGQNTTASGDGSHAEGQNTTASGNYSHAEGSNYNLSGNILPDRTVTISDVDYTIAGSTAYNISSHAEGTQSFAYGHSSHAEGIRTTASNVSSHAEGHSTTASGHYSHAEGYKTTASDDGSHAEGNSTTASGRYSHAEGHETTASNSYSHAEGNGTAARGDYSHAEGNGTDAIGSASHAEGFVTTASGIYSHAEGANTIASDDYSHAEGMSTTASGSASHAGGVSSVSSGICSFAHGNTVKATNINEIAFGKYNTSNKNTLFSIGDGTNEENTHNAFEVTSEGARVHDQVIVTTKSGFNDIRIEHGSMTFTRITSAKSYTVNFSNPFATLLGVIVSVRDTSCTASSYAIVTDESKTGFTVKASYSNGFEWFAIGTDTIVNTSIGGGEPVG